MSYFEIASEKFNKLKDKDEVVVLAIESSCDETSIAVVKNGRTLLSNVISSQIEIHKRFGGVVPEVASRNHLLSIDNVLKQSLSEANVNLNDIDAIAVTYGAGLMGALMVGVTYAKSLAYALELPLIKVNHIKAHISANYIDSDLEPPYIALIVSGGHTAIVKIEDYVNSTLIGTTTDDAVGEAYDKVSKVLGLGYPGGPVVDKMAKEGTPNIEFIKFNNSNKDFTFSFSGLKTAVINYLHKLEQKGEKPNISNVSASFQKQAVELLVKKVIHASKKYKLKTIVVAGGVAANSQLRETLINNAKKEKIEVKFPPFILCTDNAGMVGSEAYNLIRNGEGLADLSLTANPSINLKYTK